MTNFISGLLLVFHFSLIFSITLLCSILYYRTRDQQISRFLRAMIPLFLFSLIYYLFYHTGNWIDIMSSSAAEGFSLYLLIAACLSLAAYIRGVVMYLISLLVPDIEKRKIPLFATNTLIIIFLLFSIFFLILLNKASWIQALSTTLNDMFLYSSILLIIPTIFASIYLRKNKGNENYRLLSEIMIAFYPMVLTLPLDLIFFRESPFKLTLITHSLFSIFVFFYILRHYMINYEPETISLKDELAAFYTEHAVSPREQEIITRVIEGKSNREIGEVLFISANTVKTHIRNIYKKLGVSNRVQLVHAIKVDHDHDHPKK